MKRLASLLLLFFFYLTFVPEVLVFLLIVGTYFYFRDPLSWLLAEGGLFALLVLLFVLLARHVDKRSLAVGVVTRGSAQEAEADEVLHLFNLGGHLLMAIITATVPYFIISFFIFEGRFAFWLHTVFLAAMLVCVYFADRWLSRLQTRRGYG
ncbi:hypothetical protein BN137_4233 [Cronobacter condimenti 1330]|uniref:Uncharacterized protein n=1 Tax=Cronobacter condimenti 1330 TaxID=1073999 RepID=K8AGA3_9ENTR|nr:hypothetical protein [Cronobacter condimenti]ALB61480.1 hypothetical protein AFK62_02695 [Cronobacter condimenti 1330]CCJ74829.1 hypothetical protein BN137_4233 [Cronobacter condimenti 1330]